VKNLAAAKRVLGELALHMVENSHVHMTREHMCRWLDLHVLSAADPASPWQDGGDCISEIANVSSILTGAAWPFSPWRFWHRAMRDALAADTFLAQLRREVATNREEAVRVRMEATALGQEVPAWAESAGDVTEWTLLESRAASLRSGNDHWAEVYAMVVAQASNPDDVILSLAASSRSLAWRALASAPALKDSTYASILELSPSARERRQVWQQCRVVIERLERDIDPESALELLDKIRPHFHDGNNLYFISRAYDRIAAEHAHLGDRVRRHKASLFKHLLQPDRQLLAAIPGHPDRPFFTLIKAGTRPATRLHNEHQIQRDLTIERSFLLSAIPVTNEMFRRFTADRPPGKNAHAATALTWYEAVCFCEWLSQVDGFAGARLPFEAEWEYACLQGGASNAMNGEPALPDVADTLSLTPVARAMCDRSGLFDMLGHAECWCADTWSSWDGKGQALQHNPSTMMLDHAAGPRALRGGFDTNPRVVPRQAADRYQADPGSSSDALGFRIVVPRTGE
jgi:hypothetical protein